MAAPVEAPLRADPALAVTTITVGNGELVALGR